MTVSTDDSSRQIDPALDVGSPRRHGGQIRGVPLPVPAATKPEFALRCVVTTSDRAGRLADRSVLRLLGWRPHERVSFDVQDDVIKVAAEASSPTSITTQGHLRLPLAVRRSCRIDAGNRLLVSARPDTCTLIICTMAAVEAMLLTRSTDRSTGTWP